MPGGESQDPGHVGQGAPEPDGLAREVERLEKALQASQSRVAKLEQLQGSTRQGSLMKYRNYTGSLFTSDWESRYFTLIGNTLLFYKSEKDTQFLPLGRISLQNCVVEWEGKKAGRHWTFAVIDHHGRSLARCSSVDGDDARGWADALVAAGCSLKDMSACRQERQHSPTPASRKTHRSASQDPPSPSARSHSGLSSDGRGWGAGHPRGGTLTRVPSTSSIGSDASSISEAVASGRFADRAAAKQARQRDKHQKKRCPMVGSTPIHTESRFSPLSSERVRHQQHAGLLNLGAVIIVAANGRLVLENIIKYGWRFNPVARGLAVLRTGTHWQLTAAFALQLGAIALSLAIERAAVGLLREELSRAEGASKRAETKEAAHEARRVRRATAQRNEWALLAANCAVIGSTLVVPIVAITWTHSQPLPGLLLMLSAIIVWMKLISWAHCNADLRAARREGVVRRGERGDAPTDEEVTEVQAPLLYPENVTAPNLAYFIAAPTLTYQINFPRSTRFRIRWLARRLIELLFTLALQAFMVEQYILPAIDNSLAPMRHMNLLRLAERVLKLALPCMYCWLCMFYGGFHLLLNITAELLRFGDRQFYQDWWNATTVGEYWKLWNAPVHKWLLRSVYFPVIRGGGGKMTATIATFFLSAVFHELLIGVPLHMVRCWAFAGMMMQLPLVVLTDMLKKKLKNDALGNIIFWISFCVVGQPMCVLLYYHDWVVEHRPEAVEAAPTAL